MFSVVDFSIISRRQEININQVVIQLCASFPLSILGLMLLPWAVLHRNTLTKHEVRLFEQVRGRFTLEYQHTLSGHVYAIQGNFSGNNF